MKRPKPGKSADTGQPRDFYRYGPNPPYPHWPGNAQIAVNLNLNFEAGGERKLLEGDEGSEDLLSDIGFPAYHGRRSPMVESAFEHGPRIGTWRLLRIFAKFDIKVSEGLRFAGELDRAMHQNSRKEGDAIAADGG
jgi:allantoinase